MNCITQKEKNLKSGKFCKQSNSNKGIKFQNSKKAKAKILNF